MHATLSPVNFFLGGYASGLGENYYQSLPSHLGAAGGDGLTDIIIQAGKFVFPAQWTDYSKQLARDFMNLANAALDMLQAGRSGEVLNTVIPALVNEGKKMPNPSKGLEWEQKVIATLANLANSSGGQPVSMASFAAAASGEGDEDEIFPIIVGVGVGLGVIGMLWYRKRRKAQAA